MKMIRGPDVQLLVLRATMIPPFTIIVLPTGPINIAWVVFETSMHETCPLRIKGAYIPASSVGRLSRIDLNPLYALLHETIYADGPTVSAGGTSPSASPTNWSAARMFDERPDFSQQADTLLWTGEHIFPWYYTEDPALRPLAEVAELLAVKEDWGPLYNHEQLAANEVPLAAAAYIPDVYVDYEHSMKTANFVGNTRVWTSPTHHHDGLGVDGVAILGHLKNLLADMG